MSWADIVPSDEKSNQFNDTRNLANRFKGLSVNEIVLQLDNTRNKLQIAVENWTHDFNVGSIVRTANAFNLQAVHIIGKRSWNKRGAMMTDAYMHVYHHYTIEEFSAWVSGDGSLRETLRAQSLDYIKPHGKLSGEREADGKGEVSEIAPLSDTSRDKCQVVGIDILDGISTALEQETLPENCILLFGSEADGLTADAQKLVLNSSGKLLHITQTGSTRSINAGHAAAIAMYHWVLNNAAEMR